MQIANDRTLIWVVQYATSCSSSHKDPEIYHQYSVFRDNLEDSTTAESDTSTSFLDISPLCVPNPSCKSVMK